MKTQRNCDQKYLVACAIKLLEQIASGETRQKPPGFAVPIKTLPSWPNPKTRTWLACDNVSKLIKFCKLELGLAKLDKVGDVVPSQPGARLGVRPRRQVLVGHGEGRGLLAGLSAGNLVQELHHSPPDAVCVLQKQKQKELVS